jgi:hypothetical protein
MSGPIAMNPGVTKPPRIHIARDGTCVRGVISF